MRYNSIYVFINDSFKNIRIQCFEILINVPGITILKCLWQSMNRYLPNIINPIPKVTYIGNNFLPHLLIFTLAIITSMFLQFISRENICFLFCIKYSELWRPRPASSVRTLAKNTRL